MIPKGFQIVAAPEQCSIRVKVDGQPVGELVFQQDDSRLHNYRLLSGAKALRKSVGAKLANRIVLHIMHQFTRMDRNQGRIMRPWVVGSIGFMPTELADDDSKKGRKKKVC